LATNDVEGKPYVEVLKERGSGPNIKVEKGIFDLARINGEAPPPRVMMPFAQHS
jgi:fructose-bisphosphate aldolase class 1